MARLNGIQPAEQQRGDAALLYDERRQPDAVGTHTGLCAEYTQVEHRERTGDSDRRRAFAVVELDQRSAAESACKHCL